MSVRSGQILWDVNGFVIDRIQTGGVNNLNIPTERVAELGNFQTAGIIRDIPDLSFQLQSYDVSTDVEAMMVGLAPTAVAGGTGASPTPTQLDFLSTVPIDVTSPFRAGQNVFNVVNGVVIPYLSLESVAYKFGLKADAEETFSLRGDSIYYVPGVPVQETFAGGATTYTYTHGPATVYHELGNAIYALSVWWSDPTTGLYKRLFHGQDYTDSPTALTFNAGVTCPGTSRVHVCYGTAATASTSPPYYYGPTALSPVSVKPAAIRSKDMDVYITSPSASPTMLRLSGVQSFDATWKVTLTNDEEFGNPHYVSSSFDIPDVSGTIGLKGVDPNDVISKIQQLAGVPSAEIAGPLTSPPLAIEARLRDPSTHNLLKTIYCPDATITAPAIQGRVNQRLETSFTWNSNSGVFYVYKGERVGGEA
jgi:hypothetical protein